MNDIPPEDTNENQKDPPWIFLVALIAVLCTVVVALVADQYIDFIPTLYSIEPN